MKINHVITTIERGGAEKQLLLLAAEQVKLGHEVRVIPLKGKLSLINEFLQKKVKVDLILFNRPFLLQIILLLFKAFKEPKDAIFHAHLPRSELLAAFVLFRNRFYVTKHNSEPFYPNKPRWISTSLSKIVHGRAKVTILISDAVKDFLTSNNELPKDSKKLERVYYGYNWSHDLRFPHFSTPKVSNTVRLGCISRLVKQKDLYTALLTVKILKDSGHKVSLRIVGVGDLSLALTEKSTELGLSDDISWLGEQSDPFGALEEIDSLILTSRYEGFGLVLLEAIDKSIPVVASRISAIPEVMGFDYPFLANPGDPEDFSRKIIGAVTSDWEELIQTFYSRAQAKFTISNCAMKLEEIYLRT